MALNAVEQVSEQVPADDFQALEDKIYRTIEMYKAARQAQATAERDAQRLRQQMEDLGKRNWSRCGARRCG